MLLIGFSAGQIQLIDPQQKELPNSKLFNEERQIDRTAVTCLRWIPDGRSFFVASHASGNLYVSCFLIIFYNIFLFKLYNVELDSSTITPSYQILKQVIQLFFNLKQNFCFYRAIVLLFSLVNLKSTEIPFIDGRSAMGQLILLNFLVLVLILLQPSVK